MARASWDGFFVRVSSAKASPRLVEGVFGWEAGGLESIIEDSSSFYIQEIDDLSGMCALARRTFPDLLKTAPFPALNRGQSKQGHHETILFRLLRVLTFQNCHSCDGCIHGLPSPTEDCMTSSQGCFQCRPVQSLPLWAR